MTANWKAMMDDMDFEEKTLTEVRIGEDHVELMWDSMGFGYERSLAPDFKPKAGMKTKVWGEFGRPVRGLMIDNRLIYYRTPAEEEERNRQWCENKKREDEQKYAASKAENDARIAKLPKVFQDRIREFRAYSPEWGSRFEGYELFVCEQAVAFAEALKTPENIKGFHAASYERQRQEVPAMADGHSGNTFGAACQLASLYLTNPELIDKMHGALCPLVGCEDYGCFSVREKEFGLCTMKAQSRRN